MDSVGEQGVDHSQFEGIPIAISRAPMSRKTGLYSPNVELSIAPSYNFQGLDEMSLFSNDPIEQTMDPYKPISTK